MVYGDYNFLPGYAYSADHEPTGENWYIIGIDTVSKRACAAGWPPSIGQLEDFSNWVQKWPLTDDELKHRTNKFGSNWDR